VVTASPSPLKVVSKEPLGLSRAAANLADAGSPNSSPLIRVAAPPPTTILPPGARATDCTLLNPANVTTPSPPPKEVSTDPLALNRTSAAAPSLRRRPVTRILLSGWIRTSVIGMPNPRVSPRMSDTSRPSPLKVVSGWPALLKRTMPSL
jgi:hypothetical protein